MPYSRLLARGSLIRQCMNREDSRAREGPISDHRRMKTLDSLLYQWVGEADESHADKAFRTYYSAAFPLLVRHVQHRTGWDCASAEDVAQDALLRFFERAGRGRREAIAAIRSAALRLTDASHGSSHCRPIAGWASRVTALVDSAVGLASSLRNPITQEDWKLTAAHMKDRIAALQREGWRVLDEANQAPKQWNNRDSAHEPPPPSVFSITDRGAASAGLAADKVAKPSTAPAQGRRTETPGAGHAEEGIPGIDQLTTSALQIIDTLPRLRLPTNGFLFEIATSTFLDEIKRRRRKKRGGIPLCAPDSSLDACITSAPTEHPLDSLPGEPLPDADSEAWPAIPPELDPRRSSSCGDDMPSALTDPVIRYESEEFLQRFYAYLHSPVAQAIRALEVADTPAQTLAARCRLESISKKFSRMISVLALMGEGYTQDEAARRVNLSRNQVKYIIETVKEAYARFSARDPHANHSRVRREGEPHVP